MTMASKRPLKIVVCTPDANLYTHAVMSLNKHLASRCELTVKYIDAADAMRKENPETDFDVLLIDVALGDSKVYELARHFREMDPGFVLMLMIGKPEDALMGYPLKAFRCPRKDSLYEDLEACAPALLREMGIDRDTVEFQVANRLCRVYTDEVLYAEAQEQTVLIHYRGHNLEPSPIFDTLDGIERLLAPHGFYRIHQNYLINMAYLTEMAASWAVMVNGQKLPIDSSIHHSLQEKFLTQRNNQDSLRQD